MDEMPHILVVDDDDRLRQLLRKYLSDNGYLVSTAADAAEARTKLAMVEADLIVLDVMMPGEDGLSLTRHLRQSGAIPILLLTAMGEIEDRIGGLESGADDYLTKPFGVGELRARVRALLRRHQQHDDGGARHVFGDVEMDLSRHSVTRAGAEIHLTQREYNLLAVLVANPGRVLTQRYLMNEVWGPGHSEHNHYLRVYVGRLRQKLEADPTQPRHILTETGVGYRFQS
jgi:two-component system KDP operon response regulator KdpE